ncbi:MAG: hypothetical protein SVG88_04495 [Halobacteriales archaeon]|nr:hypothetical protein [Halobacteriales archaeon]
MTDDESEPLAALRRRIETENSSRLPAELRALAAAIDSPDAESVWAALRADLNEPIAPPDERPLHTVEKDRYCERCQYFSSPPAVRCTYDGSHIVELVDDDHFVLVNCPVIAGEASLQGSE